MRLFVAIIWSRGGQAVQYRILMDTAVPLHGAPFSEQTFAPVLPRLSETRPVCPSGERFLTACRPDALNIVLTAPAQLSGSYAAARSALSGQLNAVVIDSRTFGAGQLLLAARTAELAERSRFSARLAQDIRHAAENVRCFFVAPEGESAWLAGERKQRIDSRFPVFTIGREGEIRLFKTADARSAPDALFSCIRPYLKTALCAVVHDRVPAAAQALAARLTPCCARIIRGESIRTDLPFGRSGFLSAAIFHSEEEPQ